MTAMKSVTQTDVWGVRLNWRKKDCFSYPSHRGLQRDSGEGLWSPADEIKAPKLNPESPAFIQVLHIIPQSSQQDSALPVLLFLLFHLLLWPLCAAEHLQPRALAAHRGSQNTHPGIPPATERARSTSRAQGSSCSAPHVGLEHLPTAGTSSHVLTVSKPRFPHLACVLCLPSGLHLLVEVKGRNWRRTQQQKTGTRDYLTFSDTSNMILPF